MKKQLFLLLFLSAVFTTLLLCGFGGKEDISRYIPAEIPVETAGDRALAGICQKITTAGKRKNFRSLERYFNISKTDRAIAKYEKKSDPVTEQLSLLERHSDLIREAKWQIFTLEKNSSVRILRSTTDDNRSVSIVLVKRKNGYRISAIKLG